MKRFLILLTLFAVFFQSCAKSFYRDNINYTADADSLAQNHHLIAIAPPSVSIEASEEIDIRLLLYQQETASKDFQKEMYSWMLKRKMQGRITAEIQDIDTSDARLRRAGYYDGTPLSPNEICQTLGVDGVITSNYILSKPMSEGQAVESVLLESALRLHNLPGPSWPKYIISIGVHDFKTKKMIWNFDHTFVGVFSSPAHIVNVLLSDKSKKMPYIIK